MRWRDDDSRQQGDLHAATRATFQNGTCFATRRATCKTVLLADAFMIDKVSR